MINGRPQEIYQFSSHFDQQFLSELYGDDTQSAEEVFQSALIQIDQEIADADKLFAEKNVTEVRKIFHRIKPLFGYVGLMEVQDNIQQFEDNCINYRDFDGLSLSFENIKQIVSEAASKISEEREKLRDYNKQRA